MAFWLMIVGMVLHPGHATRVELSLSEDRRQFEVAMRIDAIDIEKALKHKHGRSFDVHEMTEDLAKDLIGSYLRDTIALNGQKIPPHAFVWIGWQAEPTRVWIYFELPIQADADSVIELQMKSLFEVEPELQHVFEIHDAAEKRTIIAHDADTAVKLSRR